MVWYGGDCVMGRIRSAARFRCAPSRSRAFGPMENAQEEAAYVRAQRRFFLGIFRTALCFRGDYTTISKIMGAIIKKLSKKEENDREALKKLRFFSILEQVKQKI